MQENQTLELEKKDTGLFKIEQVSEMLGVHQQTLRNWERHGLVKPLHVNGIRIYTTKDIEICKTIHKHTGKGVSLGGIQVLLENQAVKLKENDTELFKIEQVSEMLGVHQQTLRNWERHGLVKPLHVNGIRIYAQKDIEMCKTIHEYSGKGVSLDGILLLLNNT